MSFLHHHAGEHWTDPRAVRTGPECGASLDSGHHWARHRGGICGRWYGNSRVPSTACVMGLYTESMHITALLVWETVIYK